MTEATTTAACPGRGSDHCPGCAANLVQVGWYGPYGIIPGGMDNEPYPTWRPLYVER